MQVHAEEVDKLRKDMLDLKSSLEERDRTVAELMKRLDARDEEQRVRDEEMRAQLAASNKQTKKIKRRLRKLRRAFHEEQKNKVVAADSNAATNVDPIGPDQVKSKKKRKTTGDAKSNTEGEADNNSNGNDKKA